MKSEFRAVLKQPTRLQGILTSPSRMTAKLNKVIEKVYPELEELSVVPTKEQQKFKSEKYGYDEVVVEPIPEEYIIPELEDLSVTPTKQEQKFKSTKDGYDEVVVSKIPDEYIIPELEDLRVTPTKEAQVLIRIKMVMRMY